MRCPFKKNIAGVAQSVVQLIRNQQVVCSSHITSSKHCKQLRCFFYRIRETARFVICPAGNVASGRVFESHHRLQNSQTRKHLGVLLFTFSLFTFHFLPEQMGCLKLIF